MRTRDYEYLPITRKERVETSACLTQEALRTDDRAELLRAIVAYDPLGQSSQPSPVAASEQHRPQMPRHGMGRFCNVRQVPHRALRTRAVRCRRTRRQLANPARVLNSTGTCMASSSNRLSAEIACEALSIGICMNGPLADAPSISR